MRMKESMGGDEKGGAGKTKEVGSKVKTRANTGIDKSTSDQIAAGCLRLVPGSGHKSHACHIFSLLSTEGREEGDRCSCVKKEERAREETKKERREKEREEAGNLSIEMQQMRQFIVLEAVVEVAGEEIREEKQRQRRQKQMKSDTVRVKNQPRRKTAKAKSGSKEDTRKKWSK